MTRDAALQSLLVSLFSAGDLRRLLASLPDAASVLDALPEGNLSLTDLVFAMVVELKRRGLIRREFFDALEVERPRKQDEIRKVRAQFLNNARLDRGERWGDGRYELEALYGKGSFGFVWRAKDLKTAEYVALKILLEHHSEDPRILQRFSRGARVLKELSHPGIVKVRSDVLQEGLRDFYVMDLIDGTRLEAMVGVHPQEHLLEYVLQIGDALAYVHARGFQHRDVKPANILVTPRNQAKLIDFDLVTGDNSASLTTTALGTRIYAPPEAYTNESTGPAYDVFSLARTVECVLRGRDSTVADGEASIEMLDAPEPIKDVLRAAVRTEPSQRTNSVAQFCDDLRTAWRRVSERAAAEARMRAENERVAREETERVARDEAVRIEAERLARDETARNEAERLARDETERVARERAARDAAERIAREETERVARDEAAREETERVARDEAARDEAARDAAERIAREHAERVVRNEAAREEIERVARERVAREAMERDEAERVAIVDNVKPAALSPDNTNIRMDSRKDLGRVAMTDAPSAPPPVRIQLLPQRERGGTPTEPASLPKTPMVVRAGKYILVRLAALPSRMHTAVIASVALAVLSVIALSTWITLGTDPTTMKTGEQAPQNPDDGIPIQPRDVLLPEPSRTPPPIEINTPSTIKPTTPTRDREATHTSEGATEPTGLEVPAQELIRARTATRNLGHKEMLHAQSALQHIIDEPNRYGGLDETRLVLAELVLMRAITFDFAASIEPKSSGASAREQFAEDRKYAETLLAGVNEGAVNPDSLRRVKNLRALAFNQAIDPATTQNDEIAVLFKAAPLWRANAQKTPPGLVLALQGIVTPSTFSQLVLALALLRSNDREGARTVLRSVQERVVDQPATPLVAALLKRSTPPPRRPPPLDPPQKTMSAVAAGFLNVINRYCFPKRSEPTTTISVRFTIESAGGAILGLKLAEFDEKKLKDSNCIASNASAIMRAVRFADAANRPSQWEQSYVLEPEK